MKKLVLLMFFIRAIAVGQCINGTTTNPIDPKNPAFPNYLNHFNWENSTTFKYNTTYQPNSYTPNPFLSNQSAFQDIALQQDYKAENGWEAIAYNIGYDNNNNALQAPPQHTYFLLYNKFRGILRVLVKWSGVPSTFNNAQLTLQFSSGFQTNLLDMTTYEKPLLSPHIPNPKYTTNLTFFNDATSWSYADFKVNYDPCTCNFTENARLKLYTNLIQNSTINLTGAINGTITSIANGSGTDTSGGKFWSSLDGASKTFTTAHKGVKSFVDNYEKVYSTLNDNGVTINAIKSLGNFMKTNSFMKAGLAATPYVGQAVKFMSSLFGGGGGENGPLELAPMSVDLAVKLNGTVSLNAPMHDFTLGLPGSQTSASLPGIYGGQPLYNEPMGVFSLIDEPTMYYTETVTTQNEAQYYWYKNFYLEKKENSAPFAITRRKYKMSGDYLRYMINPASNLELQDAQFILVAEYIKPSLTFIDKIASPIGGGPSTGAMDINVNKDTENGLPLILYPELQNVSPFRESGVLRTSIGNPTDKDNKMFHNSFTPIGEKYFSNDYAFEFIYDIKKIRDNKVYRSDYGILGLRNINNSYNKVVKIDYIPKPEYLEPRVKSFKLKVILNLKRTDNPNAQNVLYAVTYPIKIIPLPIPLIDMTGSNYAYSSFEYSQSRTPSKPLKFVRVQDATTLNSICSSSAYRDNRIQTTSKTSNGKTQIALENHIQAENLVYHPNPVEKTLYIKLNKAQITSIIGLDGKTLNSFDLDSINKQEEAELDFSTYPKGIYFINYLDSYDKSKTAKIIRN
nr:T9SS type A sorting domain-containing protein [uncultured Flavobacterium sp.]